mmetsp:Transcript_7717/g.47814  ORF Transcript_7717/g.47814 Transcript_7717/m.47814 type:complete len:723 (-) Transcript_7717:3476-5644(-)
MRDLALLQVQIRDLHGHLETRQQLLHQKAGNRNNWIGLAVANHLCKRYTIAVQLIDGYLTIHEGGTSTEERYEMSELLLYKAWVLEEGNMLEEAIAQLDKHANEIVDKVGAKEQKARILAALGRHEEARELYLQLLGFMPDNAQYHDQLCQCVVAMAQTAGGPPENALLELYRQLQKDYPNSAACKRAPLSWLKVGEGFESAFQQYVAPLLTNGVPSIFEDVSPLMHSDEKARHIRSFFDDMLAHDKDTVKGLSSMFLAQVHARTGKQQDALNLAEQAIALLPAFPEAKLVKARILQQFGAVKEAAKIAEEAAEMDPSDRCANSVAVTLLFEAGDAERASTLAETFTKDKDAQGRILNGLDDMQCSWFALGGGRCFMQKGKIQEALNRFTVLRDFFEDFQEDQFDFHLYCLRKTTLRTYIEALRFIDSMRERQEFQDASLESIKALLALHDNEDLFREFKSSKTAGVGDIQKGVEDLSVSGTLKEGKEKQLGEPDKIKPTFKVGNPLEQACELVMQLEKNAPLAPTTHMMAFSVQARRGKWLLALRAMKHLCVLAPGSPEAHQVTARFWHAYNASLSAEGSEEIPTLVRTVVDAMRPSNLESVLEEQRQLCKVGGICAHAAAMEGVVLQQPERKDEAFSELVKALKLRALNDEGLPQLDHSECVRIHKEILLLHPSKIDNLGYLERVVLEKPLACTKHALAWVQVCATYFPHSDYFQKQNGA